MSDKSTSQNIEKKTTGNGNSLNTDNSSVDLTHSNYFSFFQYAPIPLWIEDFSKAKIHIDQIIKENQVDFIELIRKSPELLEKLSAMVVIKDVNEAGVELYKAKSKEELLGNLDKIFTPKSHDGFLQLIEAIFSGKKEAKITSINRTLEGDEFDIALKMKVAAYDKKLENVMISCENISELISSKKKLAISEGRYKQAQLLVKLGNWSYNFEKNEFYVSDEILKFIGFSEENLESDIDFFLAKLHKKDRKKFGKFSYDYLIKNPVQELKYRIKTHDNQWKHIYEKRVCTIKDNKVKSILGVCQNITDKVEAEERFDTTKNLFANTLDGINDGFVILDTNSNYTYVNEKASHFLGKKVEDLLGKNIWQEFPEKEGDLFYDNYHLAKKNNEPISFENFFEPWDKWFENRIVPSNEGVMIFFQEITDRKNRENKIREAYNIINKSSSVAILCRNTWDFPVEFASENTIDLFGYSSEEFLSNSVKIFHIVHKDDLEYISKKIVDIIKKGDFKNFKPRPFRIISKEGITKWIHANIDFIKNDENELTHIQGIVEDVTKQKITEELFFKSSQRLKDQFNNTPLASIMWDLEFKVIEWNNAAQRIFGYSFEEAVGKHANELIIPTNSTFDIDKVWQSLLNQTGGHRNTNSNVTKNGNEIICDWYNVTLKDTEGNVTGVASLVDDITERISSKELLVKSEKRYRDIFEKSFEAVLIIKDGLFVDCNESALKMFDYDVKEMFLNTHPSTLSPDIQSDGSDSFEKANRMIESTLKKGSSRFLWDHKKRNGQVFPTEVTLTRIDGIDSTPTVHTMINDITERVKKEALEDVLYNISKAALTKSDFYNFCLFVQNELHKIIDTRNFFIAINNKEKNVISTPFIVSDDKVNRNEDADMALTNEVLRSSSPVFLKREELARFIADKSLNLIEVESKIWLGVPLKLNDEVFGSIVVQSYTDENAFNQNDVSLLEFVADQISTIIQRKNAENELKEALIKAQESDRLKSAFLANMSHEIRTPMNGIIGFSELFLKENLTDKDRKKYADIVINSSQQLLSIVNDILDISKIEAGVVQLNYERVNLNEMMNNLCSFYKPIAKEKALSLECIHGLENYQSVIEIDRIKLNQVLTNLLSNAFKFTQKGGVDFGYELVDESLQFFVNDTGDGIDDKLKDKIFDRFTQANLELQKSNRGTGLGLSISKKFIELFGGKIWFSSKKQGTKVHFTIPYTKVEHNHISSVIGTVEPKEDKSDKIITLLVAEDEAYNMLYINEIFDGKPFKILEAFNGEEAISLTRNHAEIDLVFLDIKMPVMDGNEAMKIIKNERPDLPIVALSAFAMQSDKERAIKKGFDDYLTKPINRVTLFELIKKHT